jgi:hypothetical protein
VDLSNAALEDEAGVVGLQISKNRKIDFENVAARVAVRHSNIFSCARNPFTTV